MRSTKDLVKELTEEATKLTMVAIAVGFDRETKFVFHRRDAEKANLLSELNALVEAGGEPIGLVSYLILEPGNACFYTKPFPEYADESWVDGYLNSLMESVREIAEGMGMRSIPIGQPNRN